MTCTCEVPLDSPNPRNVSCNRCGLPIDPDCRCDERTIGQFYDRLQSALFRGKPSASFLRFRALAEEREQEGRERYGLAYLGKRNELEAQEEGADLANYLAFAIFQARQRGEDEEWSTALEAARHAFLACEFAMRHEAKRKGSV